MKALDANIESVSRAPAWMMCAHSIMRVVQTRAILKIRTPHMSHFLIVLRMTGFERNWSPLADFLLRQVGLNIGRLWLRHKSIVCSALYRRKC